MAISLASLPPEIITSHLLVHLGADDIFNLGKVMPLDIDKKVYDHAFHTDSHYSHYDFAMFKKRATAGLYVLGNVNAKARNLHKDFPDHYEHLPIQRRDRMHTPWKIPECGIILKASLSPKGVYILTTSGEIYYAQGTATAPYEVQKVATRDGSKNDYAPGRRGREIIERAFNGKNKKGEVPRLLPVPTAEFTRCSRKFLHNPPERVHFVEIVSSYALDDTGMVWGLNSDSLPITPLLLRDESFKVVTQPVRKLNNTTCFVEGRGIAKFVTSGTLSSKTPNGYINGHRCLDSGMCYIEVEFVPNTANVTDYAICNYAYVCLNADGTAVARPVRNDGANFDDVFQEMNLLAPFVHVYASMRAIVLFSQNGQVLVITTFTSEETGQVMIGGDLLDLPPDGEHITSIALNPTRGLAVTYDGSVFSWGIEMNGNGCLGLGKYEKALMNPEVVPVGKKSWLRANQLTRIVMPGEAYQAYVDTSYSAVLAASRN